MLRRRRRTAGRMRVSTSFSRLVSCARRHELTRTITTGLWTQLALAYAIHKSFIFIRVPLTAAVTPKVVKTLRGWGWNIGKMPSRKGAKGAINSGSGSTGSGTGINTKGTGVKPD